MERQLWKLILNILSSIRKTRWSPRGRFTDEDIVKVWMWSVLHDRPVSWACQQSNWPIHDRRWEKPSDSTMSRRMKSKSVRHLLGCLEERVLRRRNNSTLMWMIDGKPLVISGCSKDGQAGYGRAASSKAKGYKLHAIVGADKTVAEWRIAPMNKDERTIAKRMLKNADIQGYVVTDGNYDSNPLHEVCDTRGNMQLVAARRSGPSKGHGHRPQTKGRMRSMEILEAPEPHFGNDLLEQRIEIEQFFANLTNWGGGLTHLPPWARTHYRVHRWVQAKLILNALKRVQTD